MGIEPVMIEKLQQPFITNNQKDLNKRGIGLGLNICRNIVKLVGPQEQLKIKSIENEGSTFSFKIYSNIENS